MKRSPEDPSGRALLGAMLAVVVLFMAATVWSQVRLAALDEHAGLIIRNAVPSITELAAARSAVRNVELAVNEYRAGTPEARAPYAADLDASLRDLERDLARYSELPWFPGEEELYRRTVPASLARFRAAVAATRAAVDAGDAARAGQLALGELAARAGALDNDLHELVRINIEGSDQQARTIERVRTREMRIAYVLDGAGLLCALVASWLAARTVRRYTAALRERSQELELFASRVGHDVLGPLTAVSLALDTARRVVAEAPDGGRAAERIERGRASLLRTRRLVDGLLEFARAGARPVPGAHADVTEVVAGVADEVRDEASQAGVEVRVEAGGPVEVTASPGVLLSLIGNLVRNAVKHMGDRPERRVVVRAVPAGGTVRIEVEDTGPGVPPEIAPHVFDPYVRAAPAGKPGLGLGLATVKRIAEAHRGRVGLRPAPGGGSVFFVELPRAEA